MKHTALLLALALLAVIAISRVRLANTVADSSLPRLPLRSEGAMACSHGRSEAPRAQPVESRPPTYRTTPASLSDSFSSIDVYVDSGATPLAAYQLELSAYAPGHAPGQDDQHNADIKIVGIEGGDPSPFRDAPYYDPRAMQGERVIIGALSTLPADQLPRGKVRVARVHVMVTGAAIDPVCTLTLTTAAGPDAARIDATPSWRVAHTDETDARPQSERK